MNVEYDRIQNLTMGIDYVANFTTNFVDVGYYLLNI